MKPFEGHALLSFRRRDHASVLAEVEMTVFGLPGGGNIKVRRISIMQKANGERWVAWPRDKYQKNGQDTYYNLVVESGGGAPVQTNAWILSEFDEWDKIAPALPKRGDSRPAQVHEPSNPDAEDLFK